MINSFESFQKIWKEPITANEGYLAVDIDHPLSFSIGINRFGKKSLIISDLEVREEVFSTDAVGVNKLYINGTSSLEFVLNKEEYIEEFLRLCWDMIESTKHSKEPHNDLIIKYNSWLRLLRSKPKKEMSFSSQKGLLGELLYFNRLAEDGMPYEKIINSWVGPDGADQDFVFYDSWTEVKSIPLSGETVHISSLQQLNQELQGTLQVYVLEKTVKSKNSICLVDMIERIRYDFNSTNLQDRFDTKLVKYGYKKEHEEKYKKNNFRLIRTIKYRVDESFPKLTKDNVPDGIVCSEYDLSLEYISQFIEEDS